MGIEGQRRAPAKAAKPDIDSQPVVSIIDDDEAVREALSDLMQSAGYLVRVFESSSAFLESNVVDTPGCLVLDVRMPGNSGLDLQQQLVRKGQARPIIFLTGHGDIPMSVQAMKSGAVDFLTKPVRDQTLLDAVAIAIVRDSQQRAEAAISRANADLLETLTPREREVIAEVVRGRLNKQIAFDLGISEVTVKLHRSHAMRKMGTASIGELIRVWQTLPDNEQGRSI